MDEIDSRRISKVRSEMRILRVVIVALTLIFAATASAFTLPGDNFVTGWAKPVKPLIYTPESLADYIDGDAELFLELGFQQLQVQQYMSDNSEVDLEAYEFADPNGAMAIYLLRAGKENPAAGVKARNTVSETQLLAVKGKCFIQVMNYSNDKKAAAVMAELAKQALQSENAADSMTVLQQLPRAQMQPATEHIFSGPLSLQALYRLGKGDMLQLNKKTFGVAAKYDNTDLGAHTFILVPYSDVVTAQAAFANLQKSIDPGYQVFGKTVTGFAFKDRQAKYATVELKDKAIEMRVGLVKKPVVGK
jgi:hypothetical protein